MQRLNLNWLASHAVLDSNTFYRLNLNPANDEKSLRIKYWHLLTPGAIWSLPFNSRYVWSINKGQNGLAESERRARSTIRLRGFVVRYKKLSPRVRFFSRLTWLIQARTSNSNFWNRTHVTSQACFHFRGPWPKRSKHFDYSSRKNRRFERRSTGRYAFVPNSITKVYKIISTSNVLRSILVNFYRFCTRNVSGCETAFSSMYVTFSLLRSESSANKTTGLNQQFG